MSSPTPERIRSVAVLGHSHDGKTTLCEALLHVAGATARLGSTDQGTSILDFEPEEQRRSISITTSIAHCDWNGVRINLLDTPGFPDFAGEVVQALAAADSALLVVGATGSVPVGAEFAWERITAAHLPAVVVVTKMDKENAAYEATVDALREQLGRTAIAIAVPIGAAEGFRGFVDLVDDQAYEFDARGGVRKVDLPEPMREEVERAHSALVDAAAETDDALLEKYLEGTELTDEEVRGALHAAALGGTLVPILPAAASAAQGRGRGARRDQPLPARAEGAGAHRSRRQGQGGRDRVRPQRAPGRARLQDHRRPLRPGELLPGAPRHDARRLPPAQRAERPGGAAQRPRPADGQAGGHRAATSPPGDIGAVTKLAVTATGDTLCAKEAPVTLPPLAMPAAAYTMAIAAKSKGDEDKIHSALARQSDEDLTFRIDRDPDTGEEVVHGLGDTHLDVTLERIKRRYGVDASLSTPRIAYRETITGTAKVQHKHKKQTGGAGQYGDCTIEIEPLPRGGGYEWQDKIFGGSIPQQFRPSVEKGVKQTLAQGAVAGYPIVDVKVRLVDGSTHPVDGKDIAFQTAGAIAMRKAVQEARPVLLEPVVNVRVVVPERLMGDAIGILNSRRGRVAGMNPTGDGRVEVSAQVPQSEMYTFPIDLRAVTQGRGRYSMEFSHFEEVPPQVAQQLIDEYRKEHTAAAS